MKNRRTALTGMALAAAASILLAACASGEGPSESTSGGSALNLDYAYWNPLSLAVKDSACLENALGDDVPVTWVLSTGSNKANENLNAEVIDIGSTAGAASFVARANGAAIKTIGVFSQPEWSAIVVPADSTITDVAQLKGTKIAATKGTDPYFFLLQALNEAGLSQADVEIINLQHADGQAALARGDVDAWAGLDPIMATTEAKDGAKLIYRNIDFNSYGFLNAREEFLEASPDVAQVVVDAYEKARTWAQENPEKVVEILAEVAGIDIAIAEATIARTVIDIDNVPGDAQRDVLAIIGPIFVESGDVPNQELIDEALEALFNDTFATAADPDAIG